jgi:hypothetical protein
MALQTANVDGLEMVLKRIDRAIEFNKKDMAQMKKLNRQVVQIYVRYLRRPGRIKDAKEVINVPGRKPIQPGTLRNSVGTWNPNKNRATILGGPRSFNNVRKGHDAWFAHIVEDGDYADAFGGKNRSGHNYQVFEKAKKKKQPAMRKKLHDGLRKEFELYMR